MSPGPPQSVIAREPLEVDEDKVIRMAKKYRISTGQLRTWYEGGCGIDRCTRTSLVVDHDHDCCLRAPTCGQCTRGVLCSHHNGALESFIDSPAVVAYLRRTPAGLRTLTNLGYSVDGIPNRVKRPISEREAEMQARDRARKRRLRKMRKPKASARRL